MRFVDFQNLAGAFTLAPVLEGFELAGVRRVNDFGLQNVLNNRERFFPGDWTYEVNPNEKELSPVHKVGLLTATPPCSGFSLMNSSKKDNARGADSNINQCMWQVIEYAAGCTGSDGKPGPEIVMFESVQQAGKQGLTLMRRLWHTLREATGQDYNLHHVFMSGASVGAAQIRKRYFFVAARVPFGVDSPKIERVATYKDAIGDLEDLPLTMDWQWHVADPSEWLTQWSMRGAMIDAHDYNRNPYVRRMEDIAVTWALGTNHRAAAKAYYREHGRLPDSWGNFDIERIDEGFHGTARVRPDRSGYVITGAGGTSFIHYKHDRILTIRECARLMGFPDDWTWNIPSKNRAFLWVGKQLPIQNGRWISQAAFKSLNGAAPKWPGWPGDIKGEWVIDVTNDYKRVYNERTGAQEDTRNKKIADEMSWRPS
jgi:site-specific DNA-cytosine methylase